jgi:hypothetical protein
MKLKERIFAPLALFTLKYFAPTEYHQLPKVQNKGLFVLLNPNFKERKGRL